MKIKNYQKSRIKIAGIYAGEEFYYEDDENTKSGSYWVLEDGTIEENKFEWEEGLLSVDCNKFKFLPLHLQQKYQEKLENYNKFLPSIIIDEVYFIDTDGYLDFRGSNKFDLPQNKTSILLFNIVVAVYNNTIVFLKDLTIRKKNFYLDIIDLLGGDNEIASKEKYPELNDGVVFTCQIEFIYSSYNTIDGLEYDEKIHLKNFIKII